LQNGKKKARKEPEPGPIHAVPGMRHPIHASYDLAQTTTDNSKHWGQTDAYDADSANARGIRQLLVRRSRYETNNNGFIDGLTRTHATFVVRKGPKLKLINHNEEERQRNQERYARIKHDWQTWCKKIQFRRKLWCMAHAKLQDGEPLAIVRTNQNLNHMVKLDLVVIETEQCQSPLLPWGQQGYIDGIKFDEFGNPEHYDILPQHPGSINFFQSFDTEEVPAKYVLHWFEMERPGQHRGIPGLKATLGLGAVGRRWREAVVASAETIADISLIAQTQGAPNDGADEFAPFGAIEWQKRMMMMLPMGWNVFQPQGTQPPANYEMFNREHVSYVMANQAEGEMWEENPNKPPPFGWVWTRNPVADEASEVRTNSERMRTGQASPSAIAERNGDDYEELLAEMADDYGKPLDEIREALFQVNIAPKSGGTLDKTGDLDEVPEPNGEDAPNMEQMSMLVAELLDEVETLKAEALNLQAIQAGSTQTVSRQQQCLTTLIGEVSAIKQNIEA